MLIGMFGAVEDGQEEAVRFFEAWKAEVARFHETSLQIYKKTYLGKYATTFLCGQVIKEVPADRLLVWQVKQGWEPLCKVPGCQQYNMKKNLFIGLYW